MCLSEKSVFQKMDACPKEKQNCGKQKPEAQRQQEEIFVQIAFRIQIFRGKRLCDQAENAAEQDDCADIGKVIYHPIF